MDAPRTPAIPSPSCRKTRALLLACLIALIAATVIGIVCLAVFGGRDWETFHVTGDPLDVRFVGVQPAGTDDVLDAEGKKVEAFVLETGLRGGAPQRDPSHMTRWFVFEVPPSADAVGFSSHKVVTEARTHVAVSRQSTLGSPACRNKDQMAMEMVLDRSYMRKRFFGLYKSAAPVEFVDFTLRFFHGPRKAAQCTFPGPFSYGKRFLIPSACLEVHQEKSGSLPRFSFSSSGPRLRYFEPFIYSTSGVRYGPTGFNVRTDYGKSVIVGSFTVSASSLNLDKIGCITINEQPREKTFHHIRVAYPDRPGKPPKQQR